MTLEHLPSFISKQLGKEISWCSCCLVCLLYSYSRNSGLLFLL